MTSVLKRAIEHYDFVWRGLAIRVTFEPDAFGGPASFYHYSHLDVANAELHRAIPMSETGYRSLHLPAVEVEAAGGPVAYVERWLEAASRTPHWKAIEA